MLSLAQHKHILTFTNMSKYPLVGNMLLTRLVTVIVLESFTGQRHSVFGIVQKFECQM